MEDGERSYTNVIDTLFNTFSGVIERDVIATIVDSYEGDLNQSANALMSITSDSNSPNIGSTRPPPPPPPGFLYNTSQPMNVATTYNYYRDNAQSVMSYSHAHIQNRHSVSDPQYPAKRISKNILWTEQIREIITQYNKGWRILLLMRGPPGCGKTHLSRELLQMTVGCIQTKDFNTHILSTDDYFICHGVYKHDKSKLQEAHLWNQRRAQKAMSQGISPVIIDNTNIEIWEMEPYVRTAVNNGYIIHVVDPKTHWARNVNQLCKRNSHNVPFQTIKRMVENIQEGVTGDMLIQRYRLRYPPNLTPPVIRQYPPFSQNQVISTSSNSEIQDDVYSHVQNQRIEPVQTEIGKEKDKIKSEVSLIRSEIIESNESKSEENILIQDGNENKSLSLNSSTINTEPVVSPVVTTANYIEIEKRIEEFEKLEKAWDNGENWEDESQKPTVSTSSLGTIESTSSKPPRNKPVQNSPTLLNKKRLISVDPENDWSKFAAFPIVGNRHSNLVVEANSIVIEKKSSGTCIDPGDMDISKFKNPYKIITAVPRDINIFTVEKREKIPEHRMLDKSTSTNNEIITMQPFRCKNEEQHFKAFRRMFTNIPSADLRDIFENCCGDVNWAVEIVIDGMTSKRFDTIQAENLSEDEENIENVDQCECLAAYNIIPDIRPVLENEQLAIEENASILSPKKVRKEATVSDVSKQLKRQIEKNIVISDDHYSERSLKIRNARLVGEVSATDTGENINIPDNIGPMGGSTEEFNYPSTSGLSSNTKYDIHGDASDDDDDSSADEVEKTVNINIGMDLIKQLDKLFGREDMNYPENIIPKINAPLSLLNEINALWMESLMHQLEEDSKQTEAMIEQDAEFARLLIAKEEEMIISGKEPEVPDFKEIMDMDLALSLYQKDIAKWRNKEPSDLAAKMTRDKLYNLFPDIAPEILSELLMAHDNNFQNTVEVLLISTGRSDILETKNGVNKFVVDKEMERRNRLIEEQRKALSEVNWPLLPIEMDVTMEDVEHLRAEASEHLSMRQKNYRKAKEYMQRGMISVATYYSELGAFHTKLYEQASSKAVNMLVYVNAKRCQDNATLDLHNFRVVEAEESLDLFLDIHIRKLKEINGKNGVNSQTLYFLTGRGKHSPAGPRVKPAVKRRLLLRGFFIQQLNPGLLSATVTARHSMSDEIA